MDNMDEENKAMIRAKQKAEDPLKYGHLDQDE
jgi:hypothetical protein